MASGEGVTVAIVGTPFAHDHAEIKSAYNQRASYDFRTTSTRAETMRSTQLAGVVAGERGNGKCGVGIAWGANISSIGLSEQMLETGDDHLYTALTFSADDNGRLLLFSLRKIERLAMRNFFSTKQHVHSYSTSTLVFIFNAAVFIGPSSVRQAEGEYYGNFELCYL